jgi:hypothetical protein
VWGGGPPAARRPAPEADPPVSLAAQHGIIVVRAPDRGISYRRYTEVSLNAARCSATHF